MTKQLVVRVKIAGHKHEFKLTRLTEHSGGWWEIVYRCSICGAEDKHVGEPTIEAAERNGEE